MCQDILLSKEATKCGKCEKCINRCTIKLSNVSMWAGAVNLSVPKLWLKIVTTLEVKRVRYCNLGKNPCIAIAHMEKLEQVVY